MKKIFTLAAAIAFGAMSAFSAPATVTLPHSTKDYQQNPQLAFSDAERLLNEGKFDEAKECYYIYRDYTGADIGPHLDNLMHRKNDLPDWFDVNKMRVIGSLPSNGAILIIYNELMSVDLWNEEFPGEISIPGTPGKWECRTRPFVVRAINGKGIRVPSDGLIGKVKIDKFNEDQTITSKKTGEEFLLPNQEHYVQAVLYKPNGDGYNHDGGSYIKKGQMKNGAVQEMVQDNRIHKPLYYYPMKLLVKNDNNWEELGLYDRDIQINSLD